MHMDKLNSYLQGYPEFIQMPLFAIIFIVFGYFAAKISAMILAKLFHVSFPLKGETPTQGACFIRLLFWIVWLVFIIVGIVKFPLVKGVFVNVYPGNASVWEYIAICFSAAILSLSSVPLKLIITDKLRHIFEDLDFDASILSKLLGWGVFFTALVAAGITLDAPVTVQGKACATILLLGMGGILGLMVKEMVLSLLSIFNYTYSPNEIDLSISVAGYQIAKLSAPRHIYFGWLMFAVFLWAIIKMWGGF